MHVDLNGEQHSAVGESEYEYEDCVIKSKNVLPQKCYFLNKHRVGERAQVSGSPVLYIHVQLVSAGWITTVCSALISG